MTEALWTIVGAILGGAVGVWLGQLRGRRTGAEDGRRLGEQVSALTATLDEVRGQTATREDEVKTLREALEQQKVDGADAKARLESAREHFAEQRRQIEEMEKKVKETFAALSADALKSNNEQFVTLAEAKMKPLREQLERYETHLKEMEKARAEAYGGLNERLESLQDRELRLARETSQLVAALRQPGAKGKWGEVTLQRIVELAGMTKHGDFITQATQAGGSRPDLVIMLPGGRQLAIDSKVNTSAYLDAHASEDEDDRKRHLQKFVNDVRTTLRSLSAKEYWKDFSPAPEFVVMFMPGESFFATAVSLDGDLIVDGVEKRVLLASPTTLIALLLAVRHGWQQQQVADNAEKIAAAGRDLYDRLCVFTKHLDDVRVGIEKAAQSYDSAIGSWQTRTEPAARRLKELDVASDSKELTDLRSTETHMRHLLEPSNEDQT